MPHRQPWISRRLNPSAPLIELSHVGVTLSTQKGPDIVAVDDFNLHIERAEFVSLCGPSGCGKSTVLRMLAGLLQPKRLQRCVLSL